MPFQVLKLLDYYHSIVFFRPSNTKTSANKTMKTFLPNISSGEGVWTQTEEDKCTREGFAWEARVENELRGKPLIWIQSTDRWWRQRYAIQKGKGRRKRQSKYSSP